MSMCSYGSHPMDKYDTQARAPEFSGLACANCGDELQVGAEVWENDGITENVVVVHACSVGCLAVFCTEYEADLDEFELVELCTE